MPSSYTPLFTPPNDDPSNKPPETILEEAQRIIYGDREQTYGHPAKNFINIAAFWTDYLRAKYPRFDQDLTVEDVALMMVLLKLSRQLHLHKRDNLVDMAGYTACIQKIIDYENVGRSGYSGPQP